VSPSEWTPGNAQRRVNAKEWVFVLWVTWRPSLLRVPPRGLFPEVEV